MNLQLSLKTRWFEMTASGVKTEDYRELTPYWCSRLLLFRGKSKPQKWWEYEMHDTLQLYGDLGFIGHSLKFGNFTFKPFTTNTMILGYPKSTDTARIRRYKHAGIEIREGNPEFGAEPGKIYFVIKHGEPL
jgi:hypothetical protein